PTVWLDRDAYETRLERYDDCHLVLDAHEYYSCTRSWINKEKLDRRALSWCAASLTSSDDSSERTSKVDHLISVYRRVGFARWIWSGFIISLLLAAIALSSLLARRATAANPASGTIALTGPVAPFTGTWV